MLTSDGSRLTSAAIQANPDAGLEPKQVSRVAAGCIYILVVHAGALLGEPRVGLFGAVILCAANLTISLCGGSAEERRLWCCAAALTGTALVLAMAGLRGLADLVLLPPVIANLFLCYVFGRTLRPGREPLISRLCRLEHGETPLEPILRYTRRLTIAWTILFAAMAAGPALLAALGSWQAWSWVANVVNPLLIAVLFLAEHAYRARRFGGHHRPVSPANTLGRILKSGIRARP